MEHIALVPGSASGDCGAGHRALGLDRRDLRRSPIEILIVAKLGRYRIECNLSLNARQSGLIAPRSSDNELWHGTVWGMGGSRNQRLFGVSASSCLDVDVPAITRLLPAIAGIINESAPPSVDACKMSPLKDGAAVVQRVRRVLRLSRGGEIRRDRISCARYNSASLRKSLLLAE